MTLSVRVVRRVVRIAGKITAPLLSSSKAVLERQDALP
jgi:hypothetical protein